MHTASSFTQDASGRYARYHCEICSRPFDRRDTLSRHMQIHDKQRRAFKTRRKACRRCSRSKLRCDGEQHTCSSCRKRNVECIYENVRSNSGRERTALPTQTRGQTSDQNSPKQTSDQIAQSLQPSMSMLTNDTQQLQRYIDRHAIGVMNNEPQQPVPSMCQSVDQSMPASYLQEPPHINVRFDSIDFNSNLDWILDDTNTSDNFSAPGLTGSMAYHELQGLQSRFMSAPQPAVPSSLRSVTGREPSPGHAAELADLLSPQPREKGCLQGPWPVDTPRPSQRHMTLPPLGLDDPNSKMHSSFCSVRSINQTTLQILKKCLALPFEQTLTQSLGLENFPSTVKLDTCIDLYFAHFHPILDLVHQPTFDPGKDPVVTLAVISIGACYTDFEGAGAFSVALSELIHRLLLFMAEQDRRFVRTGSYLVAQLLQGTHGYCSGRERLFELSESFRGTLVSQAKNMGLFRHESQKLTVGHTSLEDEWHVWIEEESLRRLAWEIYKYDASVAHLHNNRPFISTGDINLNMPASAEHWAAETAYAWAALHPWSKSFPPQPSLCPLIRLCFDKSAQPLEEIPDLEHRFIITITLVRMLWTLKEMRSSFINDLVSSPSFDGGQTVLDVINRLTAPICTLHTGHTCTEILRVVHQMLLVHIAYVYGAGDLMNWLYPYLRHGTEAENAKRQMMQWAKQSSQRVRDVTYHCAQILGLMRNYPSNMPFEPFIIFHAGAVLSCVATIYAQSIVSYDEPPICLDQLDEGNQATSQLQGNWVIKGGDSAVMLTGVPSLFTPKGRQQVLDQTASLLQRRKVWGMARNLTKVVLSLSSYEPDIEPNTE